MINGANTKSNEHDKHHAYVTRSGSLLHAAVFSVEAWLA